ncbi:MAG: hypothetical protein AAF802_11275 [Planctomycetota bacterium]
MMEFLGDPAVKAGVALLILIIVSAAAFFLLSRLRDYTDGDWDSSSEGLLNLEEMRLRGEISEDEFRTLKAASHAIDGENASTQPADSMTEQPSGPS